MPTEREIERKTKKLKKLRQGGETLEDLPMLSIAILMSAEDFKSTDIDRVIAVDLKGDGNWELYRQFDWTKQPGYSP